MNKTLIISEGRSNAYLAHGMGVLAIIVALTFISGWVLLLFPMAIALFFASSGVEIDPAALRVRKYIGLMSWRKGIWLPVKHFTKVELDETLVMHQHKTFFRYQKSTSRTYDVVLSQSSGGHFQLNDFFDYHQAVLCGEALAKLLNVKLQNHYEAKTLEMLQKPRRR